MTLLMDASLLAFVEMRFLPLNQPIYSIVGHLYWLESFSRFEPNSKEKKESPNMPKT